MGRGNTDVKCLCSLSLSVLPCEHPLTAWAPGLSKPLADLMHTAPNHVRQLNRGDTTKRIPSPGGQLPTVSTLLTPFSHERSASRGERASDGLRFRFFAATREKLLRPTGRMLPISSAVYTGTWTGQHTLSGVQDFFNPSQRVNMRVN